MEEQGSDMDISAEELGLRALESAVEEVRGRNCGEEHGH